MTQRVIAFNLLFIDGGNLTGPGYYAVQLLNAFVRLPQIARGEYRLICYAQPAARRHFQDICKSFFRYCRDLPERFARVTYEQIVLPFLTRKDGVDLLFSPAFVSPMWGSRHLVVGICDMYYRVIPAAVERFQRQYWRIMIPASVRRCDHVITISESSRVDIETYLPWARGRTTVTPLASRISEYDGIASIPPHRPCPYVLMVANLTPNKNCEVVVAAVSRLRERGIDVEFVHVGHDNGGRLLAASKAYSAQKFVHSVGKVSDAALRGYYEDCVCVITPSFYEGFGMPAVEAQAMGAVLISSNRGALPEAAGDGALFFDPEDVDGLAIALAQVITDTDLSSALRTRGRVSATRFSWEKTAVGTLAAFGTVLDA